MFIPLEAEQQQNTLIESIPTGFTSNLEVASARNQQQQEQQP